MTNNIRTFRRIIAFNLIYLNENDFEFETMKKTQNHWSIYSLHPLPERNGFNYARQL